MVLILGRDGTDDDVIFKIASDLNTVTCSHKLSHTFSDDWRRNKLETWLKKDLPALVPDLPNVVLDLPTLVRKLKCPGR